MKSIDIYYKGGNDYININDPRFKNNKDFTKYLCGKQMGLS